MTLSVLDVSDELSAHDPPEARGLRRDQVKLLVAHRSTGALVHRRFTDLPALLHAGDALVVNVSKTLPASVPARLAADKIRAHVSTALGSGLHLIELRRPDGFSSLPLFAGDPGQEIDLPEGAKARLLSKYPGSERIWFARLDLPEDLTTYLLANGDVIRYGRVLEKWPLSVYQTPFARIPGSAEMPGAARPFTGEIVAELISSGVDIIPVLLHTGLSSPEAHEPPMEERYAVSAFSAHRINAVRQNGGRIVAVGTTAVRAIESAADEWGVVRPSEGLTTLVVSPKRGVRTVDGLLTGWHEPSASHLSLVEAVAGRPALDSSYEAALAGGYRFHEFGDSHLILP